MKIAIASSGLGHITRGIEAWAHDLAHALHQRGENVILCKGAGTPSHDFERVIPCLRRSKSWLKKLPNRGLWRIGLGSPYEIESTTFALNLIPVLRREKIDILHVQDPLIALIIQRARTAKLVKTLAILGHGTNESVSFLNKINFLQHLAPCNKFQASAQGADKKTWATIPNFVDTDIFHPGSSDTIRQSLSIPRDAIVILSVAAIKRDHKRIDHLIQEFATLIQQNPNRPAHLIIAGGAESDTEELLALGQQQLAARFHPLVRFPREQIPELYRAADIFAMTSLREMMPIALIEATASGLPCLIHNHASLQWIVGDGGQAVDMGAQGALAQAIKNLIEDNSLRTQLGLNARSHCLGNFSKDHVVQQILSYYRYVLATSSVSASSKSPRADGPLPADACESAAIVGK